MDMALVARLEGEMSGRRSEVGCSLEGMLDALEGNGHQVRKAARRASHVRRRITEESTNLGGRMLGLMREEVCVGQTGNGAAMLRSQRLP